MTARHHQHAWLQWVGVAGALQLDDAQRPLPAPDCGFFTQRDMAFLAAAIGRLLKTCPFHHATQTQVLAYIDRQLSGAYGHEAQISLKQPHEADHPHPHFVLGFTPAAMYRESLDALHSHDDGRSFAKRSPEHQDAFLRKLEAGHWLLQRVPSAVFYATLSVNMKEACRADPLHPIGCDAAGAHIATLHLTVDHRALASRVFDGKNG